MVMHHLSLLQTISTITISKGVTGGLKAARFHKIGDNNGSNSNS